MMRPRFHPHLMYAERKLRYFALTKSNSVVQSHLECPNHQCRFMQLSKTRKKLRGLVCTDTWFTRSSKFVSRIKKIIFSWKLSAWIVAINPSKYPTNEKKLRGLIFTPAWFTRSLKFYSMMKKIICSRENRLWTLKSLESNNLSIRHPTKIMGTRFQPLLN